MVLISPLLDTSSDPETDIDPTVTPTPAPVPDTVPIPGPVPEEELVVVRGGDGEDDSDAIDVTDGCLTD